MHNQTNIEQRSTSNEFYMICFGQIPIRHKAKLNAFIAKTTNRKNVQKIKQTDMGSELMILYYGEFNNIVNICKEYLKKTDSQRVFFRKAPIASNPEGSDLITMIEQQEINDIVYNQPRRDFTFVDNDITVARKYRSGFRQTIFLPVNTNLNKEKIIIYLHEKAEQIKQVMDLKVQ